MTPSSIILEAEILESTERVSGLADVEKKCRFQNHNESGLMFFNKYGYKKCLFECLWVQAKQQCSCVPWNYPQIRADSESNICTGGGNACWNDLFNQGTNLQNCKHCLKDCDQIRYKYFTTQQLLTESDCYRRCVSCLFKKNRI